MAFFVPCTTAFEDAVKNKQSLRYWKILIDIDDDDVLEDVTEYVDNNQVTGSGKIAGANNESVANSYRVVLRNPNNTFEAGDFAFAKCQIQAKVGTAEYIVLFTGFVGEEGCIRKINNFTDDSVTINMYDYTKNLAMQRKTPKITWVNYKILDADVKASSIMHQLAYLLGFSDSDLDFGGDIDLTKSYIAYNEEKVWSELQKIAQQYLGTITFRYDGKLRFRSRFESGYVTPTSEWEFSEDENNIHSLKINGGKVICNRAYTQFDQHAVLSQRTIYRNVTGYNVVIQKILISVAPGEYWPGGTRDSDYAELDYVEPDTGFKYDIGINIVTPTLGGTGSGNDIESDGGTMTLESFNGVAGTNPSKTNQLAGRSQIILKNNTGGTITITKMILRGQPVRVEKNIRVEDLDTTISNEWEYRDKQIDGRYAISPEQATITTQYWVEYGKDRKNIYDIETDWIPQIQEGAFVNLIVPTYNINNLCEVISYSHPAANGPMGSQKTKIVLREYLDYTPAAQPENIVYVETGQADAEGIDDTAQEIETRPTYTEIIDGFDDGGGTTTPTQVTISNCRSIGVRGIALEWDRQLNLTNLDRYEIQVSDDDSTWYSLKFDGTDWKDSLGAFTTWYSEFLVQPAIPLGGTADDPTDVLLYYRVRRVTKDAVNGTWSTSSSAYARATGEGDYAAGTIYANNIKAGQIETWFLFALSAVTVGFAGSGSHGSPQNFDLRAVIDNDEMYWQEYRNAWVTFLKIGGSLLGRLLTMIDCNGIYANENTPVSFEILPDSSYAYFDFEDQTAQSVRGGYALTLTNCGIFSGAAKFGTYNLGPAGGVPPWSSSYSVTIGGGLSDFTGSCWVKYSSVTSVDMGGFGIGFGSNGVALDYNWSTNQLRVWALKGGTRTNGAYVSAAFNVWHFVAFSLDVSTNTVTWVINSTNGTINPTGTWGSGTKSMSGLIGNNDGAGNVIHVNLDDIIFSPTHAMDLVDMQKHYTNGVAWHGEYNRDDIILRPAAGGRLIFDTQQSYPQMGQYHHTTFQSVTSYLPLTSTIQSYQFTSWVPNGAKMVRLIVYGSAVTGNFYALFGKDPTLTIIDETFFNYGSSVVDKTIDLPITSDKTFYVKAAVGTGNIYIKLIGFWI